jgi:hypothetical protein
LEGLRVKEKEKREREEKDRRKKVHSGEEWISPVLEVRICAAVKWDWIVKSVTSRGGMNFK